MASPVDEQSNKVLDSTITAEVSNQEVGQNQQNISAPEMTDTDQDLNLQHHFNSSQPLTSEFHHHAVEEGAPSAGSAFHVVSQTDGQKDRLTVEQPDSEPDKNELSEIVSLNSEDSRSVEGQNREDSGIGGKLFSAHIVEQQTSKHEDTGLDILNESQNIQELPMSAGEEDVLLGMSETKTAVEEMIIDDIEGIGKALQASESDDNFSEVRPKHLNEDLKMSDIKPITDFQFLKPTVMENSTKDSSVVSNSVDNDVENELGKQHASPLHKPEEVFNIDEETRMGLDQTPVDPTMIEASFIYPTLPPKKLFHLDDTKDSEPSDTETKMSALCDTEDIRLRNTISIDDATKDSAASDSNTETPTPSRKQRRASREGLGISLMEGLEAGERVFTADNLFEYQWPQDGGEWHLLQEQISEYLKVKSFKRKYPDLYRRTCDKEEKDFLRDKGVVTETQSDLGLTALRSEEVYDLMMKDYNSKYKDYISHLQEKQKKVIREKHKEYSAQAKLDKSKIETYSKKAARSAAEFNASLMRDKKEERRAYFDLQTYTIHFPKNKFRTLPPQYTKVGAYPVALIPGQFQEKYRKYSAEELKYYPLKTSIRDPPKVVKYVRPPPPGAKLPISDKQKASTNSDAEDSDSSAKEDNDDGNEDNDNGENEDKENENSQSEGLDMLSPVKLEKKAKAAMKRKSLKLGTPERQKKSAKKSKDVELDISVDKAIQEAEEKITSPDSKKMPGKIHGLEKCRICKKRSTKEERKADKLVKCAECGKIGHMGCLDLTEELVAVIKTYPWQCMECKTCVECLDPYDEDKMMFCDRCDRGYHTFCIGLHALPTGHWECKSCEGSPKLLDRPKPNLVERGHPGRPRKIPLVIAPEPPPSEMNEPEEVVKIEGDVKGEDVQAPTESLQEQQQVNPEKAEKDASSSEKDGTGSSETGTPTSVGYKRRKLSAAPQVTPKSTDKLTPKPVSSKQDRIQGARQSRRLKIKVEEEEERRKMDDDDDDKTSKKKRKKKYSKTAEDETEINSSYKEVMEESENTGFKVERGIVRDETSSDDLREVVSEGADDSFVNLFDTNDSGDKDMEVTDYVTDEGNIEAQTSSAAYIDQKGDMDISIHKMEEVSSEVISANNMGEVSIGTDNIKELEIRSATDENKGEPAFSLALADTADVLVQSEAMSQGTEVLAGSEVDTMTPAVCSVLEETGYTPLPATQNTVNYQAFSDPAYSVPDADCQSQTELQTLSQPTPSSLPMGDIVQPQFALPESLPLEELHAESSHTKKQEPQSLLVTPSQIPYPQPSQAETVLSPLHQSLGLQLPAAISEDLDPSAQTRVTLQLQDGQLLLEPNQSNSECVDICVGDLNVPQLVADACLPAQSSLEDDTYMDMDEEQSEREEKTGDELIDHLLGDNVQQ